ncbi:MAG: nicotinate-nucleotide adenylyltransferase [Chloroflexi bacterium]|nr:nicotinate-nucleotide adenylyltransferase [Chloroflexota bacterium]
MTRRLGLLGGTFDPPHFGHLLAAQEAASQLDLERVLFLPARQNPLKQEESVTAAEDRWAMVTRAIADNPLFEASPLDMERPPPSYTVDLLRALEGSDRELFFVIGADILPELPNWRSPDEILRLARLAVVNRPGAPPLDLAALDRALPSARGRIEVVRIPGVAISAREMRDRVHAGRSIRYLTPTAVERFIEARSLYR